MRLLLDTHVLSEVTKLRPAERVLNWLHGLDEDRTFISIISIAEIRRSVALMDIGRKRDAPDAWLTHDLPQRLDNRIFPVEAHVALASGDLMAIGQAKRPGTCTINGLIAATAVVRDLTLATRNIKDFEGFGIDLVDAWVV